MAELTKEHTKAADWVKGNMIAHIETIRQYISGFGNNFTDATVSIIVRTPQLESKGMVFTADKVEDLEEVLKSAREMLKT